MKVTLASERVVQRDRHELYTAILEEIRHGPDGAAARPSIVDSNSAVAPGQEVVRVKPYESIEVRPAKQDRMGASAVIGFQSVGPASTQIRLTITLDIGLGMWLFLKLFGRRAGIDRFPDEAMDELVRELDGLGDRREDAPR